MLKKSYASLGCQNQFFAAVDLTMLAYYLLQRKPPFPHAWVATRVAPSRDLNHGTTVRLCGDAGPHITGHTLRCHNNAWLPSA